MEAFFYLVLGGLSIWWLAQIVVCFCDYFQRLWDARKMPPPTEEEKLALARVRADFPPKERHPVSWYIENPREALKQGWIFIPVLVFFWPMAVLFLALPPIKVRLSIDLVRRLNAEKDERST